jgi:Ring hydroxylating alpha subunit (catalytic domain)
LIFEADFVTAEHPLDVAKRMLHLGSYLCLESFRLALNTIFGKLATLARTHGNVPIQDRGPIRRFPGNVWKSKVAFSRAVQDQPEVTAPYHTMTDVQLTDVLQQDADNVAINQRGIKSDGFRGMYLGDQELRLRHFHNCLDQYLAED